MNKKRIILFIILVLYLIVVFVSEPFYRKELYEISVKYIKEIKQTGFFHIFYFFWSVIFLYTMMGLGVFIPTFFFPLNIAFTYLSIEILLIFIMCILKSIYSQERPYWDIYLEKDKEIKLPSPTECDGEFGNPSGHALLSTFLLPLWDLFLSSNFFKNLEGKKKYIAKFLTLFFVIISIIFICYSRINRQIHSFNQVIFGSILGIAVYFIFCHLIDINNVSSEVFSLQLDKLKFILLPLCLILFTLSVIFGLTIHNEREAEYQQILEKYCKFNPGQIFGKNTALHSSLMFVIIGIYLGFVFLSHKIKTNYPTKGNVFYNWNQGKLLTTIIIALLSFLLPNIIPALFYLLVPYRLYVLKMITHCVSFLLDGFLIIGPCFYYSCFYFKKNELINKDDYDLLTNSDDVNNN